MENAIIIKSNNQFQSKDLNTATARLAKCFQNIDKNRKDACIVMWHVEDKKAYIEDGFKSLEEYANAIGIEKSTAHKMADAGMIWDNHNPVIAEKAKSLDYTTVSTLASLDKRDNDGNLKQGVDLAKAIEDGELDNLKSVDDFKSWKATAIQKTKPEKVVPNWHIVGHALKRYGSPNSAVYEEIDTTIGIENPKDWGCEWWTEARVSELKDEQGNKMYLAICPDGSMFFYIAEKVKKERSKKEKPVVKPITAYTREELEAALAALK